MKNETKDGAFGKILKWVGYLTAILSLCVTLAGIGKYGYDKAGNRNSLVDPLGRRSSQAYNANNRLLADTDPAATIVMIWRIFVVSSAAPRMSCAC